MIIILLLGNKLTAVYVLFGEQTEGEGQHAAWRTQSWQTLRHCPVRRDSFPLVTATAPSQGVV